MDGRVVLCCFALFVFSRFGNELKNDHFWSLICNCFFVRRNGCLGWFNNECQWIVSCRAPAPAHADEHHEAGGASELKVRPPLPYYHHQWLLNCQHFLFHCSNVKMLSALSWTNSWKSTLTNGANSASRRSRSWSAWRRSKPSARFVFCSFLSAAVRQ